MPTTIGYLRVSTQDQDLEKNKADILHLANEKDLGKVEWAEEKASGSIRWRDRKIGDVIQRLGTGDRIIIPELSRLGRSMLEIMELLSIAKDKGISIYEIKHGWTLNGSIESKILAMVFSMAAEIERDLISKRTKEALRARKAAGVKIGRPKGSTSKSKLDTHKEEIITLLKNGSPKTYIARRFGSSNGNLFYWLRSRKLTHIKPISGAEEGKA